MELKLQDVDQGSDFILPREGEILLFLLSFDQHQPCSELLSEDELERAGRFHFDRDRRNYIIARGTLRQILGSMLALSPQALQFDYEELGKPFLTHPVCFNISHTKQRAIYAFCLERDIGVDIEEYRTVRDADDIAEHFFTQREQTLIKAAQEPYKSDLFLQMWTLKEAWLKAKGTGLQAPLNEVDTAFAADQQRMHLNDYELAKISIPNGKASVCWKA